MFGNRKYREGWNFDTLVGGIMGFRCGVKDEGDKDDAIVSGLNNLEVKLFYQEGVARRGTHLGYIYVVRILLSPVKERTLVLGAPGS